MKRIISLTLALLLLFSSVALTLTSCGKDETKKGDTEKTADTTAPAEEGDIFAERAAVSDELGEYDFGGKKFRIATHKPSDFFVEEDNRNKGDLIADAKFNRNTTVENRFNAEIEITYTGTYSDVTAWVTKTVMSGADEFDLFASHTASAGGVVLKNVFLNWYDIPNVDFTKPWWSSSCANELTYDGKCILAVSDFNFSAISGSYCIIFNKNLANAYDLGNLYDVVLSGKWTFDYFYNLVKDIYADTDGSGDRNTGDFFGFAQSGAYQCCDSSWLWAFDNPTVAKDEDGIPVVAVKTEKINDIVTSLYDFFYNTNGVHYEPDNTAPQGLTLLLNKQAIFATASISSPTGEGLRNFEDEYGVLPFPKWDENQNAYHTMASGEHTCMAVPKTVKDTEFVGTLVEALSAESYKQVIPTLYEIALKTRYLRDNESKEVLDLLIDGRVYDFGYIYDNFQGFGFMLGSLMHSQNSNFESYYAKKYPNARLHFKKIVKVFDKLG